MIAHLRVLCLILVSVMLGLAKPAYAQGNEPDALQALEEARAVLAEAPGHERARKAFIQALQKATLFERDGKRFEQANILVDELIMHFDRRLAANPTDANMLWRRYHALKIKYFIVRNSMQDLEELEDVAIKAEADVSRLLSAAPERSRYRLEYARALNRLAWHYISNTDRSKALTLYDEASDLARDLLQEKPKDSGALYVLATGSYYSTWARAQEADTYEAYEALIPLYEDAILAYKNLADVNDESQVMQERSRIWFELAEVYRKLGDDAEAIKAARTGFHFLEILAETMPDNDQVAQNLYYTAAQLMTISSRPEDKIIWGERTRDLIILARDNGHLLPQHTELLSEVERTISYNNKILQKNASAP